MKATGIVRRIDDLGRVVIPKEIRKNLDIKDGDPLELFIDEEDKIILQPIKEKTKTVEDFEKEIFDFLSEDDIHDLIRKLVCNYV